MTYLVFDLETIPDRTLHTPPPGEEGAFAPLHAQIPVVIGLMWLEQDLTFRRLWTLADELDEPGRLRAFSDLVLQHRPLLVSFNGRGFDLPVILLRALHAGLSLPWMFEERYRVRHGEEGHIDLCDALSLHGISRRGVSLDATARLIGLPGKVGVDGSQVEGLYRSGRLDAIRRYCLADVAQTGLLLLRYRLLQGVLTAETYRIAARTLLDALARDGQVPDLLRQIDETRLLGAP